MKRLTALLAAGSLAFAGLVAASPVSPAQAATVKACVSKKSGELRFLTGTTKKKCKRGWKKIVWNQRGPAGPTGPQGARGPQLVVKDGTGAVLGPLVGQFGGGFPVMTVLLNGGSYPYLANGKVFGLTSPKWISNDCTGTAFLDTTSTDTRDLLVASAGSASRITYRATSPVGQASAWAFSSEVQTVGPIALYERNNTGACVLDAAAFNGYLISLVSVATPPDVPGPLTLAVN